MATGKANGKLATMVVAVACVLALVAYKGTTMARINVTGTTKQLTTGTTTAPATTTPVAMAPHAHAQPTAVNGMPASGWQVVGTPSTAKRATNGVGPVPAPGSVGLAALQAIAKGGSQGATWASVVAAVHACNTVKPHKLMPLLTWLAKNRGYSFSFANGMLTCSNLPANL